jgi:hypothetical protein
MPGSCGAWTMPPAMRKVARSGRFSHSCVTNFTVAGAPLDAGDRPQRRTSAHDMSATREAAMAAFAKSWRGESWARAPAADAWSNGAPIRRRSMMLDARPQRNSSRNWSSRIITEPRGPISRLRPRLSRSQPDRRSHHQSRRPEVRALRHCYPCSFSIQASADHPIAGAATLA